MNISWWYLIAATVNLAIGYDQYTRDRDYLAWFLLAWSIVFVILAAIGYQGFMAEGWPDV